MELRSARTEDTAIVRNIAVYTINTIYPRYYPSGVVTFFTEHHSVKNITDDITSGCVYILYDAGIPVGTVTIKENEILRLFVLPEHQSRGFGKYMLDIAESMVFAEFDSVIVDSSLPAQTVYLRRGYKEFEYIQLVTPDGDVLCYDRMEKTRQMP